MRDDATQKDFSPAFRADSDPLVETETGILRITILGATAVLCLSLFAIPVAKRSVERIVASQMSPGIDPILTGSIERPPHQYTIRKSVLDSSEAMPAPPLRR